MSDYELIFALHPFQQGTEIEKVPVMALVQTYLTYIGVILPRDGVVRIIVQGGNFLDKAQFLAMTNYRKASLKHSLESKYVLERHGRGRSLFEQQLGKAKELKLFNDEPICPSLVITHCDENKHKIRDLLVLSPKKRQVVVMKAHSPEDLVRGDRLAAAGDSVMCSHYYVKYSVGSSSSSGEDIVHISDIRKIEVDEAYDWLMDRMSRVMNLSEDGDAMEVNRSADIFSDNDGQDGNRVEEENRSLHVAQDRIDTERNDTENDDDEFEADDQDILVIDEEPKEHTEQSSGQVHLLLLVLDPVRNSAAYMKGVQVKQLAKDAISSVLAADELLPVRMVLVSNKANVPMEAPTQIMKCTGPVQCRFLTADATDKEKVLMKKVPFHADPRIFENAKGAPITCSTKYSTYVAHHGGICDILNSVEHNTRYGFCTESIHHLIEPGDDAKHFWIQFVVEEKEVRILQVQPVCRQEARTRLANRVAPLIAAKRPAAIPKNEVSLKHALKAFRMKEDGGCLLFLSGSVAARSKNVVEAFTSAASDKKPIAVIALDVGANAFTKLVREVDEKAFFTITYESNVVTDFYDTRSSRVVILSKFKFEQFVDEMHRRTISLCDYKNCIFPLLPSVLGPDISDVVKVFVGEGMNSSIDMLMDWSEIDFYCKV